MAFYNHNVYFRYLSSDSSRTAGRCSPGKTFLLVAAFALSLMVIGGGGAEVQHAVKLGQVVASDPTPYHLTGDAWSILDLSAPQSGYAFAQTLGTSLTDGAFVTTWRTTSADKSITLPLIGSGMTVDWGDGNTTTASGSVSHTYNTAGDYTVQITGGLTGFHLNGATDASKLVSIDQWGTASWTYLQNAFRGAKNMVYNAGDVPNFSGVNDMSSMFFFTPSFNGNLSSWDVSSVTDMSNMFTLASSFNGNLSSWDVSSVTDMKRMFNDAASFNQPLNSWDVSSATRMDYMFRKAVSFNQPLNSWDVSSATGMSNTFQNITSFDQNLGNWYVTLDSDTIADTAIPGVVGTISAQNLPLRNHFPTYAIVDDDDLDADHFEIVSGNRLNMTSGVPGEYSINVTASGTNVFESGNNWRLLEIEVTGQIPDTMVTDLTVGAFVTTWRTTSADKSITLPLVGSGMTVNWGDGNTTTASGSVSHTYNVAGDHTIQITGGLTEFRLNGADDAPKLVSLDQWGDASWTSMENAFKGATNMVYNADDAPDLSGVTDMSGMFYKATVFDGDLSSWDVSSVTDMSEMFREAVTFNQPLNSWNVSSVTNMGGMFGTTIFNQPLNSWYVSSVTDMSHMFSDSTFNGNISSWDVSSVTDMSGMFHNAQAFNRPLDSWNVSSVTDMSEMFDNTRAFNQPLDSWNVSSVTDMAWMFARTSSFNGDVSSWNVSSVTDMSGMFHNAQAFNQNLGNWYVVLSGTTISDINETLTISAQNSFLNGQNPTYAVADTHFVISNGALAVNYDQIPLAGTYNVTITTTGSFGVGNARTVEITADDVQSNRPPTVEVGPAQTVQEGFEVSLNGSATDPDEDVMTYLWTHNSTSSDITLANATSASTTFTAPRVDSDTAIIFTLTADDGTATSSDSVIITVTAPVNSPPSVEAGSAQTVQEGSEVSLNGSATDPDEDVMTYLWTHNSTTLDIALANATSASTTFTAPRVDSDTAIIFTLTADDGTATSSDSVIITVTAPVNSPPSVEAGPAQTVQEGSEVSLNGSATDPDEDVMTYLWTHNSTSSDIALANATSASTTFTAPRVDSDTAIIFTLTADDGTATSSDSVIITVTAPVNLTLAVTSIPAGTTPEAAFVTTWQTTSANEFILIPVGESTGTYTVTWGDASIDTDVSGHQMHTYKNAGTYTVSIYGDFSQIYLPYYIESALKMQSIEQWGDIRWESMRSAFSGATNMVYRATDAPDLSDVTDTSEMFMFATSFNGNLSTWDVSHVTDMRRMFDIATAFNGDISSWNVSGVTDMSDMFLAAWAFTQNLGDWYIVLGETTISDANTMLAISAQNAYLDGQNPVYTIDLIAPGGDKFRIVNGSHLATRTDQTVAPGQYNVTIKSTGSFGTDNSKIVGITVSEDVILQTNSLPSVEAGSAQTVQEGSEVSLNGSATDPDEDVMTYLWTHNSTSSDITLANDTSASTTFTAPRVDSDTAIIFTLTADDGTATSSDSVIITVTAPVNSPPSVEAGPAQTVQEGSEVSLNGSATDPDEDVMTYLWTHNSTSSDITLANDTSASTTFTAPRVDSDTAIIFTLTADDGTATSSDSVIITVTAPVNSPPSVEAGPAQTVQEGSEVSLNGSATDPDEDVMTYLWTHNSTSSDITLANDTSASTTFTAPRVDSDTAIIFTLTADDGTATSSDSVIITVTAPVNSPPSVEAGPAQTVQEGSEVSLNGSATDPDEDVMTYLWTHNSTSSDITLANDTSASTTFTAPRVDSDTAIIFTLTADDGTATSSDSVIITVTAPVNSPPSVEAGPAQTVQEGSEVSLNGSATDPDEDVMTYLWTHNSTSSDITLANDTSASTTFTAPRVDSDTAIIFTLTADDGTATSSDSVIITVTAPVNSPPSVEAGPAQTVQEGSEVSLNGSATDPDEDVMTYLWTHNSTSSDITLANDTSASTTFTAPRVDSDTAIIFTLTADDGTATSSDSVIITVTAPVNSPPSVEAGPAQTVQEGSEVSLNGSATDPDEDVMTYLWTHNSTSSDIALANDTSASTTFTAPRVDSDTAIIFTLTADDGTATSSDSVIITVTAPVNSPPSVEAGPAQTVQEGSEVSLNGSATDPDEDVMTYLWTHNSTSSDITLANDTSASTTFTAPRVDSDCHHLHTDTDCR